MEMSRGVICIIHQDYYPIEETNLWHTIYFNKLPYLLALLFVQYIISALQKYTFYFI